MAHADASTTPVIIAVGEVVDRPATPEQGREPAALMAEALREAGRDGGGGLLGALTSIDVVGLVSWRYRDPAARVCEMLGVTPARMTNASMGGETPIRLIHEAAVRIASGEACVAAIVGGEAVSARRKARAAGAVLDWTPQVSTEDVAKVDFRKLMLAPSARKAGATDPAHIYPLFDSAFEAHADRTPREGGDVSAQLWAEYAAVAADNPYAWNRDGLSADDIGTPSETNRMVAFPYPKLMTANPMVNQAAAVIVTSLAQARAMGADETQLVFIQGGAAAQEPLDYLEHAEYHRSPAQDAVLAAAIAQVGGDVNVFDVLELYSCFPVVPKMAFETLRARGLRADAAPTVTGGLTFFGGPLNNYMAHATAAMVRRLRAREGRTGLLYGQGGVFTKHHALIVSSEPPAAALPANYSVQADADRARPPAPTVLEAYVGPATVETYTIVYDPKGQPLHGVVIARSPDGDRMITKVRREDETSMALLSDRDRSAAGATGHVRIDAFDTMVWEEGALRDRRAIVRDHVQVERRGKLTIITMNRPDALNAMQPKTNEELAEVFDAFEADPDQWVAIITGAGDRAFSAGNDLKYTASAMARGEGTPIPTMGFGGLTARWGRAKPVIAAVNGIAVGGGFEVALACDVIIASEDATFALPEPKVGLAALAGGLHRLARQIGEKRAMSMILTGRTVTAEEGRDLGFVAEVTSKDALMETATRWADEIMACSPMSVRASKQIVERGFDEPSLQAAYDNQMSYPAVRALFRSDDFREGPRAFAEKRPPKWRGS